MTPPTTTTLEPNRTVVAMQATMDSILALLHKIDPPTDTCSVSVEITPWYGPKIQLHPSTSFDADHVRGRLPGATWEMHDQLGSVWEECRYDGVTVNLYAPRCPDDEVGL